MKIRLTMTLNIQRGKDNPPQQQDRYDLWDVSGADVARKPQWDYDDKPPVRLGFQPNEGGK